MTIANILIFAGLFGSLSNNAQTDAFLPINVPSLVNTKKLSLSSGKLYTQQDHHEPEECLIDDMINEKTPSSKKNMGAIFNQKNVAIAEKNRKDNEKKKRAKETRVIPEGIDADCSSYEECMIVFPNATKEQINSYFESLIEDNYFNI